MRKKRILPFLLSLLILCSSLQLPVDAKEMDAFKQAVASAAVPASATRRQPRGPLLGPGSGHEEGGEFSVSDLGSLGATQYGELR